MRGFDAPPASAKFRVRFLQMASISQFDAGVGQSDGRY
jgi:hypothetical protein